MTPAELALRLVSFTGMARRAPGGPGAVPALLGRLRCLQLDPLEPLGSQADLAALARVDGLVRGDVYRALLPGHAFEHYAKERCLLPADTWPHYRRRAAGDAGWRFSSRHEELPAALLDAVEAEVRERGPVAPGDLTDRGRVTPVDWSGWKGTSKASTMALEALSLKCRLVVAGRRGREKVYDVPERALPDHHDRAPRGGFERWGVLERARASGLLPTRSGPHWGLLREARSTVAPELVAQGHLRAVKVGNRTWWALPEFLDGPVTEPDDDLRLVGPLDPLIWDRDLVRLLFGFDYVWEVYKPAAQRKYGWYVVPLLHRGHFVGRLNATFADGRIRVDHVWAEAGATIDAVAFDRALDRHERALRGDRA